MTTSHAALATLAGALLLITGCSGVSAPADPTGPTSVATSTVTVDSAPETPTPATSEPVDLASLAASGDARLGAVTLTRDQRSYDARSVRIIQAENGRTSYLLARSSTDAPTRFRRVRSRVAFDAVYARTSGSPRFGSCSAVVGGIALCTGQGAGRVLWTSDAGATWQRHDAALGRLLISPVPSLTRDTFAVIGGGDGATLFPFEKFERSTDGGETWEGGDFPRFDGALAYENGSVVLADGRLLSVLGNFSDDRPGRRVDRVHGLYVSSGSDWTALVPLDPTFDPPLPTTNGYSAIDTVNASADPDPVVWVTTTEGTFYVSTDNAATFSQLDLD
ncbi:hypothetical protein BH09ACT12_BH09ACT12_02780 [soil metagenome]